MGMNVGVEMMTPPVANLLPDSACNRACRGDNTQMCGAGWKNNVYKKSGKMHLRLFILLS